MEKIVETQEGRLGKIIFKDAVNGIGIEEGKLENTIKAKCKIYPNGGIIVHMTKEEYEKILKEKDSHKRYQEMLRQYDKK